MYMAELSREVKHAWISLSKVSIKVFSSSSTYIDMCGSKQDEIVPRKLNAIAACNRDDYEDRQAGVNMC